MKSVATVVAGAVFVLLAGCGPGTPSIETVAPSSRATPSANPAAPTHRVGLVLKTLTNPFFIDMEKGARRAEHEFGLELVVKTGSQETSIEEQIQIVQDMIDSKIDAIVIAPGDSQRIVDILKHAREQNIKIVNIDNRIDQGELTRESMAPIPFISVDNAEAAYASAHYLAESVSVPSEAAILEGIRSADNGRQRVAGALRAFGENHLIHVVASESADWKIDEAHDVTREILKRHPHVHLIFAANDMMAIGALKYLNETGRHDVRVAGYDAVPEALDEIRSGRLAATVDQQAAEQGYQGVATAVQLMQGATVPMVTMIDTRLVTAQTLK